ncbi:hypothetical protein ABDC18_002867 [Escherichia coli]
MLTSEQKHALSRLQGKEHLITALCDHIKAEYLTSIGKTDVHESKARETLYLKSTVIDDIKIEISKCVNFVNNTSL